MSGGRCPTRATFWLLEAPDSLAEQSRRNPDGYGTGTFAEDGSPEVHKRPAAALENAHPFELDGRLFAHNGHFGGLDELDQRLGEAGALDAASPAGTVRVRSSGLAKRRAVIFASEQMDEDPGWRALESGELVRVDGELEVSSRMLLDRPPARQLRMEDLEPDVARSQRGRNRQPFPTA